MPAVPKKTESSTFIVPVVFHRCHLPLHQQTDTEKNQRHTITVRMRATVIVIFCVNLRRLLCEEQRFRFRQTHNVCTTPNCLVVMFRRCPPHNISDDSFSRFRFRQNGLFRGGTCCTRSRGEKLRIRFLNGTDRFKVFRQFCVCGSRL